MKAISLILPTNNAERYLVEAVRSILKQSFTDFELIVSDENSTDRTPEIVGSFDDPRVVFITGSNNRCEALNRALKVAQGNYIARVGAEDILSAARLTVQHTLMEEESSVTVCGSLLTPVGEGIRGSKPLHIRAGLIEHPLETLLSGNVLFDTTVMFRKEFVDRHGLCYENFQGLEDYRMWCRVAHAGGVFYIEPQSLQFHRMDLNSSERPKIDMGVYHALLEEVLDWLLARHGTSYPELIGLYEDMKRAYARRLFTESEIQAFFASAFANIYKSKNS